MRKMLFLLGFCALLAFALQAQAMLITPDYYVRTGNNAQVTFTTGTNLWTGNQTANLDARAIATIIGISATTPFDELYKQNTGVPLPGDTGPLASSYSTSFSNTSTAPSDATITYLAGPSASSPVYLFVKDGRQTPAWYLFDLSGIWNGRDTLYLQGFWPDQGSISHVALYGTAVPVPTAAWLLGTGLIGLVAIRRRIRK